MLKYKHKKGLLEKIVSGFKKTAVVGAFALAGLIQQSCVPLDEPDYHQNIANSVSDQGRKKIEEGDLETGINYIKEAADIRKPDMFDSYQLGMHYKKEGELEKAEKYFKRAISVWMRDKKLNDKKNEIKSNAFLELGRIYWERDEDKKAIKSLKSSFNINDNNKEGHDLYYTITLKHLKKADITNMITASAAYLLNDEKGYESYGITYYVNYNDFIATIGGSIFNNDREYETDPRFSWTKETEFFVGAGGKILGESNHAKLFLLAAAGYSYQEVPVNEDSYLEKKENFTFGVQFGGFNKKEKIALFIGLHNRRGMVWDIGFYF